MIKLLLRAGAAVNKRDSLGRTPLHRHLGSRCRRKEIVVLLVSNGAKVNVADKKGRTVLQQAAQRNPRDPLAELLRQHGAKD
jgi:ankyrin repeat protein